MADALTHLRCGLLFPLSAASEQPYRGGNVLTLWATYKQWHDLVSDGPGG